MIFDKQLTASSKQQLLATGYSTDVIDLGQAHPAGLDDLNFAVVVSAESGTNPTLTAELQHSTDNSTFTVAASIVKPSGKKVFGFSLRDLKLNRYQRVRYALGGTSPDYTVTAGLLTGVQDWIATADSVRIA